MANAPLPEWVPLLGTYLGLAAGLLALQALMVVTAMLVQTHMGYFDFQPGVDARTLTGTEWIDFAATFGTDEDQIAVVPGARRRTWTEGGRRYFEYATDVPIR